MYWQCDLYFKKFLLFFYIFGCKTLYLKASLVLFVVSSSVVISYLNTIWIKVSVFVLRSSWLEELSYSLSHHGYLIVLKETYENYKSRRWEKFLSHGLIQHKLFIDRIQNPFIQKVSLFKELTMLDLCYKYSTSHLTMRNVHSHFYSCHAIDSLFIKTREP